MTTYQRFSSLLKHSCQIHPHTTTTDALTGEVKETWTVVSTSVACLIQPITGEQAIQEQGLELLSDFKAFFLSTQTINLRDKVIFDGKTFYVNYIFENWTGGADHKEVNLKMETTTSGI